jgi:acyl-coenzyme A synthetase/AMP-(fatty) acid ligase
VLHRSARRVADLTGSIALHGTGPVTAAVTEAVAGLTGRGMRAVELFGSTETGGIAHRSMLAGAAEPWRLLPDVSLVGDAGADGTCLLHVRSPRIARRRGEPATGTHRLADIVRPVGSDRFVFLGRSGRLVKINGRRCDLGLIEEVIAATVPDIDVVCVGVPDWVRGEHYELFHTGGPAVDTRLLCAALGDLPRPRAVHRVDRVPRTITGKVKVDRLFAEAGGVTGA